VVVNDCFFVSKCERERKKMILDFFFVNEEREKSVGKNLG